MKKGEVIYFLIDYELMKGIVESIGKKNVKICITYWNGNTKSIYKPFDKVTEPDEMICVVWEQWKGKNGRGGYRLERTLYKNRQRIAKEWPHQALVWEDAYGIESDNIDPRLDGGEWYRKKIGNSTSMKECLNKLIK